MIGENGMIFIITAFVQPIGICRAKAESYYLSIFRLGTYNQCLILAASENDLKIGFGFSI